MVFFTMLINDIHDFICSSICHELAIGTDIVKLFVGLTGIFDLNFRTKKFKTGQIGFTSVNYFKGSFLVVR